MKRYQTPSQTVGPFFAFGLTPKQYGYPFSQLLSGRIEGKGKRITITGQVFDGKGVAITDALVELWQEEGIARQGTGTTLDASFRFETVKPSKPYIDVIVFMRGLLSHVYTRLYFDDEAKANNADDVLASVAEERRDTLIARHEGQGHYRFDIRMQGEHETVFFDL
jgi:protocatechuate 3,4-dioxygenase alpha subunit